LRCSGSLRAEVVEAQVWAAVVRVLEQPELIAAEVARQESQADEQRAEIGQQLARIAGGLAKCDRETERWRNAYAEEVINLAELKAYRADIETRRQSLLAEQATCQARLDAIGTAAQHTDALTDYCARVRRRLRAFDATEKRIAFEALAVVVYWGPGEPLHLEGSIPIGQIVDSAANSTFMPRVSR
jgi:hypothetical protein